MEFWRQGGCFSHVALVLARGGAKGQNNGRKRDRDQTRVRIPLGPPNCCWWCLIVPCLRNLQKFFKHGVSPPPRESRYVLTPDSVRRLSHYRAVSRVRPVRSPAHGGTRCADPSAP